MTEPTGKRTNLLNRHITEARSKTAERLTKLLDREYDIAMGKVKGSVAECNAIKNQIIRILPQVAPEDLKELRKEFDPATAIDKVIDTVINDKSGKIREGLRAKGYELKPIIKEVKENRDTGIVSV